MRALVGLLLFASSVFAQNQIPAAVPQSACGRGEVQYDVKRDQGQHIPEADPTKVLVYIIQDEQTVDPCIQCTITTRIGLDGSWIGANNGGSYFFFKSGSRRATSVRELAISLRRSVPVDRVNRLYGRGGEDVLL